MNYWIIASFVGLGSMMSFGQTHKRVSYSKYADACGLLVIPCAIALIWAMALEFGWWTIAIFIVLSLIVGTLNGMVMRSQEGVHGLVSMQPALGTIFIVCSVISWWPVLARL